MDKVSDEVNCTVARPEAGVIVFLAPPMVSVGLNRTPGSPVALRIDKKPGHTESSRGVFAFKEAQAIVSEMKQGSKLLARSTDWPDSSYTDREVSLEGFSLALEVAEWVQKHIRP